MRCHNALLNDILRLLSNLQKALQDEREAIDRSPFLFALSIKASSWDREFEQYLSSHSPLHGYKPQEQEKAFLVSHLRSKLQRCLPAFYTKMNLMSSG